MLAPMNDDDRLRLKAQILDKLNRRGYWGGRHTSFERVMVSLPSDIRGDAKKAGEELMPSIDVSPMSM
jgi:hypothetical protein